MNAEIDTLLTKLESGEIIKFNKNLFILNSEESSIKKFKKNIKNEYIALPVSLFKFHGLSIKSNQQFLKFKILKSFKNIQSFFNINYKLLNYIDITSGSRLNKDEEKIINIFKKLNLLPLPIFFKLNNYKFGKIKSFKLNSIFKQLNQSKILFRNQTLLPLKKNENVKIYLFDDLIQKVTHYVLVFNFDKIKTTPNVRIHSSCLTGDLMGSQKCDCGYQLNTAVDYMSKSKSIGLLIYLNQEGRGMGIHNKIISYNIQNNGFDTYEADNILGYSGDERNYKAAIKILKFFKFKNLNLITNNPEKIDSLRNNGIKVSKIIKIKPGVNKYNKNYLNTKKIIGKHLINL